MEGIETPLCRIITRSHLRSSRCPDMEGIETCIERHPVSVPLVPVGAPTWRGLKRPKSQNSLGTNLCQ